MQVPSRTLNFTMIEEREAIANSFKRADAVLKAEKRTKDTNCDKRVAFAINAAVGDFKVPVPKKKKYVGKTSTDDFLEDRIFRGCDNFFDYLLD